MTERDHVVYLLEVMRQVLESIDDDNDPASASLMLRTCLKEYADALPDPVQTTPDAGAGEAPHRTA